MKYYYFTFIAAVFLAFAADSTAQDYRSSIRYWNEGRLTWDDFRQESFHADSIASAIYWSFETFPVKKRYGNLTVSKLESHLLMDKTLSWVRPDCMTGHYLKYPQIIFDIAELYRRKFQSEIDRTPNLYRQLFSFYDNACDKSIEEFKFLSDSGDNTEQISIYERKINKELENGLLEKEIKFHHNWNKAALLMSKNQTKQSLELYKKLYTINHKNNLFLYNYGAELNRTQSYKESIKVLNQCTKYWNDYYIEILLANNYINLQEWNAAENHFQKASDMCPNRFFPLYKLHIIYQQTNQEKLATEMAKTIINKKVKINSPLIHSIKNRMKKFLLSND